MGFAPTASPCSPSRSIKLWNVTYCIAIPLGAIVMGLIVWCAVRYRERKGEERIPPQHQYHLPLEMALHGASRSSW